MIKRVNRNIVKSKAFTLVELLVVIAIIGIITVLSASAFKNVQFKARDSRRKSDLDSIAKALNMYFADNNQYPLATDSGEVDGMNTLLDEGGMFANDDGTIYMKELPTEEVSDMQYTYVVSSDRKSFRLYSILENEDDQVSCLHYVINGWNNPDNLDECNSQYTDCCYYGVCSPNIGMTGSMSGEE